MRDDEVNADYVVEALNTFGFWWNVARRRSESHRKFREALARFNIRPFVVGDE